MVKLSGVLIGIVVAGIIMFILSDFMGNLMNNYGLTPMSEDDVNYTKFYSSINDVNSMTEKLGNETHGASIESGFFFVPSTFSSLKALLGIVNIGNTMIQIIAGYLKIPAFIVTAAGLIILIIIVFAIFSIFARSET